MAVINLAFLYSSAAIMRPSMTYRPLDPFLFFSTIWPCFAHWSNLPRSNLGERAPQGCQRTNDPITKEESRKPWMTPIKLFRISGWLHIKSIEHLSQLAKMLWKIIEINKYLLTCSVKSFLASWIKSKRRNHDISRLKNKFCDVKQGGQLYFLFFIDKSVNIWFRERTHGADLPQSPLLTFKLLGLFQDQVTDILSWCRFWFVSIWE